MAIAALAGCVLAVLAFGLVGDGFNSSSPSRYRYDASEDALPVVGCDGVEDGREHVLLTCSAADLGGRRGYDDRSHLARASARLDGDRVAPNTAASIADDVPAFARSQYGRVLAAERAAALERAPTCPYCGTSPSSQVDHISALRRDWGAGGWADDFATRTGRVNDPGNLIGACASCNASKGARAIGEGAGQWWPSGWPSGSWWPFGGPM